MDTRTLGARGHRHAIVAGGAGFIGSNLVRRLVADRFTVTVLDNLSSGRRGALPRCDAVRFLFHDVADPVPAAVPHADVIFHLASPAVPRDYESRPLATLDSNDLGTRRLVDRALRHGAVFVYASTSEVYGDVPAVVGRGTSETDVAHAALMTPRSCYAEAKRFGEELVLAANRERGLDGRIVRLFNVYGPGMDPRGPARVIPTFVRAALEEEALPIFGDGTQTRSFCWIDDALDALMRLAAVPNGAGLIVNVGNPEMVSINELAKRVLAHVGGGRIVHVARDPHEPRWRCPDISRARESLGWSPRVPLDAGLERVLDARPADRLEAKGTAVVVPTYRRAESLRRCVDALARLDPAPDDVVVIDDGSPGGIPEWLAAWERDERGPRRQVIVHDRNRGPAAARNTGVAAAKAAFVAFTDDDCEPRRDWLGQIAARLESEPMRVAGVGGRVTARRDNIVSRYYVGQRILEAPTDRSYLVTANACFRRDLVLAVGGFDESIRTAGGEDPGLCFALAREGFTFEHEPRAAVVHDFRPGLIDFVKTFYRYGKGCAHVARALD